MPAERSCRLHGINLQWVGRCSSKQKSANSWILNSTFFCGALSFKVLSTCNSSNVLVFCRQIFLVVWIVTLSNIIVLSCYHFTRTLHQKDRWNPKGKFVYLFSVDLCGWARVPLQCYFGKARLFSRSNPFYTFSPFYALRETKYLQSFWACSRAYDSNELDPSVSRTARPINPWYCTEKSAELGCDLLGSIRVMPTNSVAARPPSSSSTNLQVRGGSCDQVSAVSLSVAPKMVTGFWSLVSI